MLSRASLAATTLLFFVVSVLFQVPSAQAGFSEPASFPTGVSPASVAVADLNADQRLDLVTANSGSATLSVLTGKADGTFNARADYPTGVGPYSVVVTDVNADERPDLISANAGDDSLSVLTGKPDGTFNAKVDYPTGLDPFSLSFADVNADKWPDLVAANYSSNSLSVLTGKADGTFNAKADYSTGASPNSVAIADVNSDQRPDLVTANFGSNSLSVLTGKADGTFNGKVDFTTGAGPASVAISELNGDQWPDLVAANFLSNTLSVLTGRADGTFNAKVDYSTHTGPYSVAVADTNGDLREDLVSANNYSGTISILTGKADGTFNTKADYSTNTNPYTAAVADVDGDQKPDLVAPTPNSNSVSVLSNLAATATVSPGSLAFGGQVVGAAGVSRSVVVSNSAGGDPLRVSGVSVAGMDASEFSVASEGCSQAPVGVGGSCEVRVAFSPSSVGVKEARLVVGHDGFGGKDLEVALTGTGAAKDTPPPSPKAGEAIFDGRTLSLRLRCPASAKPACMGKAFVYASKSRKAKPITIRPAPAKQKAGRFKVVKLVVKDAYRARVAAFAKTPVKRTLVVKQTQKIKGKARTLTHTYKVKGT